MSAVRVSVALATRNGARYLPAQLDSILGQTRRVDQIVVSDDASTDGTLDLAREKLEPSGIDVVAVSNDPPLGVAGNFQAALAACDGDVILLSDQDDVWHPDRVAASVEVLGDGSRWLALHGDARLVDAEGEPLGTTLLDSLEVPAEARASIVAGDAFPQFLRRNLATGATMAIRRELLTLALPVPTGWIHDEWLAMVAASVGRLTLVDRPLIDYRQHGANEIGIAEPTFRGKARRVLSPRGDRNRVLAARAASLDERLATVDVAEPVRTAAAAKRRFETERAELPQSRIRRLPTIARLARRGEYGRYASRGSADVLRDLLQPW